MGTSKLSGKPDEMLGGYLRTGIPSRRSSNTPTSFPGPLSFSSLVVEEKERRPGDEVGNTPGRFMLLKPG